VRSGLAALVDSRWLTTVFDSVFDFDIDSGHDSVFASPFVDPKVDVVAAELKTIMARVVCRNHWNITLPQYALSTFALCTFAMSNRIQSLRNISSQVPKSILTALTSYFIRHAVILCTLQLCDLIPIPKVSKYFNTTTEGDIYTLHFRTSHF